MADRGSLGSVVLEQSIAGVHTVFRVLGALLLGGLALGLLWVEWLKWTRGEGSPTYVLIAVMAIGVVLALRVLVLTLANARMKVTVFEGGLAFEHTRGAGVFAWAELRSAHIESYMLSTRTELVITLRDGSTRLLETAFPDNDKLFELIQARLPSAGPSPRAR